MARRWHNHLPGWILEHEAYRGLRPAGRQLLQCIADACDRPDREGGLDGAFGSYTCFASLIGASERTVRRAVHKLIACGFLVRKTPGGRMHIRQRAGTLHVSSAYAIPGQMRPPAVPLGKGDGAAVDHHPRTKWPPPLVNLTTTTGQNGHPPSYEPSLVSSLEHNTMRDGGFQHRTGKRQWRVQDKHLGHWRTVGALYAEAQCLGLIGEATDDALYFFVAAVHAKRVGTQNPAGLFNRMIRQRAQRWMFITAADQRRGAQWHRAWTQERGYA